MARANDHQPNHVRVEVSRRFPVPLARGFDYITDIRNWPDYWPDFVRLEPGSRWEEPGDRARLVLRMLGRGVALEMLLARIEEQRLVEYTSVQAGLPPARHERHFAAADGGFEYRLVIEYEPRHGARGWFDRIILRRAVARAARRTTTNLGRVLAPGDPVITPRRVAAAPQSWRTTHHRR